VDKKDEQILEYLTENSSLTTREIAEKTGIPITTVHKRIKKLKQEGIIKKFTIELDNKKIEKGFSAIILVSCDYKLLKELKKDQHQLAKELSHIPEVVSVDVVTGIIDIVVKVRMKDVEAFDTFLLKTIQKILGIDHTQSLVVMYEA